MRFALCLSLLMTTGCSKSGGEAAHAGQEARNETAHAVQADPQLTTRDNQEPPKDRPPPDDRAIPQDMAKTEERERKRMEWHLRTSVGAYDKVGKKRRRAGMISPARRWIWRSAKASNLIPRSPCRGQPGGESCRRRRLRRSTGGQYLHPKLERAYHLGTENLIRRWRDTTEAYAASHYPAFRRAGSLESFAAG